jgi:hypothetical protein
MKILIKNYIPKNLKKFNREQLIKIGIFLTLFLEITNTNYDLTIKIYGNIIGFTILIAVLSNYIKKSQLTIAIATLIYVFYIIINPHYFINEIDPYKAYLYTILAIILAKGLKNEEIIAWIKDVFYNYTKIILILFLFFNIGVDQVGLTSRMQGLMSEPSALSLILTFLFINFIEQKEIKKLIIVLIASFVTYSLIVYINIILSYIIYKISLKKKKFIIMWVILFILFASIIVKILSNIETENWIIQKASLATKYIISLGEEGGYSRAINISVLIEEQYRTNYSWLIGNGPFYGVTYFRERDMLTMTHNVPSILFFDYGIIGLIMGIFWTAFALIVFTKTKYSILFISTLVYCLINTASGIINDIYFFSLLFLSLILTNKKKKMIEKEEEKIV